MLKYREYYKMCLTPSAGELEYLYNFGYKVLEVSDFPPKYDQLITAANEDLNHKLKDSNNIFTPPGKPQESQPLIRLKNPWDLKNVEEIAKCVIPIVEDQVYSCPAHVHGCYVYQTQPGDFLKDSVGSLFWHIDNHPKEVIKAMVYLNDVDTNTAPFEILSGQQQGSGLKIETKRVDYTKWSSSPFRFTEGFVAAKVKEGYRPHSILGPAGTVCYFDNNVLHRANKSKTKKRNVIVFMMKPTTDVLDKYISREYTGTNYHIDTFKNPGFIGAIKK